MFALDACKSTVKQALSARADLLVTHHPLFFQPIEQSAVDSPIGAALMEAVRGDLVIYSAHTNLDVSPQGINVSLAELLKLTGRRVLYPIDSGGDFKLVVFVPSPALVSLRDAAFKAGAGRIGSYSKCSFSVAGQGTFFGDKTTAPSVGESGQLETVAEARLEMLVPEKRLRSVLDAVRRKHPYEKPAIDVYPLAGQGFETGLGLTGLLPSRTSVGEIAVNLRAVLSTKVIRLVGRKGRKIRHVAICAGSGSSLLKEVLASGAELFITGDLKYHEARTAEENGLSILDVGHYAPERYGLARFSTLVAGKFKQNGWKVDISFAKEKDPFAPVD
jgi:dinuclear metal center YbgI/SA1388 family protein